MFSGFSMLYLSGYYNVLCQPVDYSDSLNAGGALFLGHCFFLSKGMYFYYMMSSMGPEVKRTLWWKRYITAIQILQFVLLSLHAAQSLYRGCDFPKMTTYITLFIGLKYFSLFLNFYLKAYMGIRPGVSTLLEKEVRPRIFTKSIRVMNEIGPEEQNGFLTQEKKTE